MNKTYQKTTLQEANEAFQAGLYQAALDLYITAIRNNRSLEKITKINISLSLSRLGFEHDDESVNTYLKSHLRPKSPEVGVHIEPTDFPLVYENSVDAEFYMSMYPDIQAANADPFVHYTTWGWKEGRLPNSWFDPNFYREQYIDAKETNQDPLAHYIEIGQYEKRKTKTFSISSVPKYIKKEIPTISFDETSEAYVDFKVQPEIASKIKALAFYLPQFHPFPENDAWWGKGFTEWSNVAKAKPNYDGHYQPHLPIHNGFYDLRVPEVMVEQARLAKNYGIYGFNFYYYWFDGKVLMHKPFEMLLNNKDVDIKYCLTWANENWTRRWDGAENDVLIGQNHCESDSIKFIEHLYQYFEDDRYITIDGKPVLIIYRANIIPDMAETIELWQRKAREAGFPGLYLIGAQTFGFKNPKEFGFDASMEFPPHTVKSNKINDSLDIVNANFAGNIYDYEEVVRNSCTEKEFTYKCFRTAMLSWDNTARKQDNSHTFANFTLLKYKQWLTHIATRTHDTATLSDQEKFIFINAWNEWAEGTHLEPDRKHGYGYLQATYDVLKEFDIKNVEKLSTEQPVRKNNYAVILHIHYTDIWDEISHYLKNLKGYGFDLFVTLTNTQNNIVDLIKKDYPDAYVNLVENRGRDIRPFIETYRKIKNLDYDAVCKIHSKKSVYRNDGDNIRNEIYESLLGTKDLIGSILEKFDQEANVLGLLVPKKYFIPHTSKNMSYDRDIVLGLSALLDLDFSYSDFPAGSMYWFAPRALSGLEMIEDHYFEPEEGLADGTIAHGIERIICSLAEKNGFIGRSYES
ncbi:glycoside hydrolase family 99-like domain-containing protein [Cellvibrio polysaccharolyticus]|nr:glycoside hydrolase family 99-like domain-containing protein [Cellvibrio polysaccharolyticus]